MGSGDGEALVGLLQVACAEEGLSTKATGAAPIRRLLGLYHPFIEGLLMYAVSTRY